MGSDDSLGQVWWLTSRDAIDFCQKPRERNMEIFAMKLKPKAIMLKIMKKPWDVFVSK